MECRCIKRGSHMTCTVSSNLDDDYICNYCKMLSILCDIRNALEDIRDRLPEVDVDIDDEVIR